MTIGVTDDWKTVLADEETGCKVKTNSRASTVSQSLPMRSSAAL